MTRIVKDLFIIPRYDDSKITVTFTSPRGCSSAQWAIIDGNKQIAHGNIDIKKSHEVDFEAPIENFKPWNVDTPHLYTLKLFLTIDGKNVEASENFGMRKIHATTDGIYVNNKPFCARGYIRGRDAHDHPNFEALSLEEFYAKNIRKAKEYGFNLIRFHSRVPLEECFNVADRLGIFIHIEVRDYYGRYQKERNMMNDEGELISSDQWGGVILRNRNHPSLMVYCMGNEIRHPGTNPQVAEIASITKELDPTRLFIDTCAHGEFDRDYVDIDVQHMSYYYPFGKNYDMFNNTYNWYIYGSSKGVTLVQQGEKADCSYKITRALSAGHPVLAHEICHYIALHDIKSLDEKFNRIGVQKPWWIDELKKLIKLKGLEKDYPMMLAASKYFQFLSWKLGIESVRRSPLLQGFHFLQLSDTERYENSNGILDCFDDCKGVDEKEFLKFNADTVILADLPRRTYFESESVTIPVILSHFSPEIAGNADFSFSVKSSNDSSVSISGVLKDINLDEMGRREISNLELNLPRIHSPSKLTITFKLTSEGGSDIVANNWDIWVYPDRPNELPEMACTVLLDDVHTNSRYPQLKATGNPESPERLLIVNRFSKAVIRHLANGGDVLMLYRVPETRSLRVSSQKEEYYLPATWDRFKGVIWDRGTNCGAFIRDNNVLDYFPNDGFIDLQFHSLIDDCDKIVLDDFPCPVEPIIQGVDKAVRDRFDVYTYNLPEFQPDWTMRKFAYMFELKVGKGRLFVTGFNFTGVNTGKPEACAMFESVMRYICSDSFQPRAAISAEELESYLLRKGKEPRIKERKMTQFWQLDEAPLESSQYWEDAERYIEQG